MRCCDSLDLVSLHHLFRQPPPLLASRVRDGGGFEPAGDGGDVEPRQPREFGHVGSEAVPAEDQRFLRLGNAGRLWLPGAFRDAVPCARGSPRRRTRRRRAGLTALRAPRPCRPCRPARRRKPRSGAVRPPSFYIFLRGQRWDEANRRTLPTSVSARVLNCR